MLALHEPTPLDCTNDEILSVLHRVVEKGYVRLVSIAGSPASIVAGVTKSALYGAAQLADNPFEQMLDSMREELRGRELFFITHSVFGRPALVEQRALTQLQHLLARDNGELAALFSQLGYELPTMMADLLLDYALAKNCDGVVLASSLGPGRIEANCGRAVLPPRDDIVDIVHQAISRTGDLALLWQN